MEKQGKFNEMRRWKKVETIICVIFFFKFIEKWKWRENEKEEEKKSNKVKKKNMKKIN